MTKVELLEESEEELSKDLSFEIILVKHLDRISRLLTYPADFDTLSKFQNAVTCLMKMLEPYADDEFKKNIEKINKETEEEIRKIPLQVEIKEKKSAQILYHSTFEIFGECIKLLDRKGLLLKRAGEEEL